MSMELAKMDSRERSHRDLANPAHLARLCLNYLYVDRTSHASDQARCVYIQLLPSAAHWNNNNVPLLGGTLLIRVILCATINTPIPMCHGTLIVY